MHEKTRDMKEHVFGRACDTEHRTYDVIFAIAISTSASTPTDGLEYGRQVKTQCRNREDNKQSSTR